MLHYTPLHVSSGFSAHHQELIKVYVQPCVLSCFPAAGERTSPLSTRVLYGCLQRVTIPEAVVIQLVPLTMSSVLLETCCGVYCNIYIVED